MKTNRLSHRQRKAFWKRHVLAWRQSGLTQVKYAAQKGFSTHSLRYWIKQFPESKPAPVEDKPIEVGGSRSQDNGFRLVSVSPEAEVPASQTAQVAVASPLGVTLTRERLTIQLPGPLDRESLALLLQQMGGA